MPEADRCLCQVGVMGDRKGYGSLFILFSVGRFVVSVGLTALLTLVCFLFYFTDIMVQERPAAVSALDKHRHRAAEQKGRCSIKVMHAHKGSASRPFPEIQKTPKRCWERCHHHPFPWVHANTSPGSPSPRWVENVVGPPKAGARASPSPLDLLGGGLQFTRRVCVALPEETRESIRGVSPSDLLRRDLELMCRSIVLVKHGFKAETVVPRMCRHGASAGPGL